VHSDFPNALYYVSTTRVTNTVKVTCLYLIVFPHSKWTDKWPNTAPLHASTFLSQFYLPAISTTFTDTFLSVISIYFSYVFPSFISPLTYLFLDALFSFQSRGPISRCPCPACFTCVAFQRHEYCRYVTPCIGLPLRHSLLLFTGCLLRIRMAASRKFLSPIFFLGEFTLKVHNRYLERCNPSRERRTFHNEPQHILVFTTFGGLRPEPGSPPPRYGSFVAWIGTTLIF
jgi:hypothetical protein